MYFFLSHLPGHLLVAALIVFFYIALYTPHRIYSTNICLEDAYKLDEVRSALRQGDIKAASKYGKIYELRQVTNV